MNSRLYQLGIVTLCVAALFVFTNCQGGGGVPPIAGKVTGGGYVVTPTGGKANFGFNGSSCENPLEPTGRFNFHDMTAPGYPGGVKMNGAVIDAVQCNDPLGCISLDVPGETCPYKGYIVEVGYKSTNPRNRGLGTAWACVVDNGEGKTGTGDLLGLAVETGPYQDYALKGTVQGNIQAHACPVP